MTCFAFEYSGSFVAVAVAVVELYHYHQASLVRCFCPAFFQSSNTSARRRSCHRHDGLSSSQALPAKQLHYILLLLIFFAIKGTKQIIKFFVCHDGRPYSKMEMKHRIHHQWF